MLMFELSSILSITEIYRYIRISGDFAERDAGLGVQTERDGGGRWRHDGAWVLSSGQ
jgi:hypothetical protein